MPVLNGHTPLNVDFDSWQLAPQHNDLRAMISMLEFSDTRPTFYLLNTGETHYPYATPDEPENEWPVIHGVHGVFKRAGGGSMLTEAEAGFHQDRLDQLRARQIQTVTWVDQAVEELIDALPENTWLTITADHGELFGEDGFFGHGPIHHSKVIEVPFVEGLVR
jgi:arylsulfatase A-like enzyme